MKWVCYVGIIWKLGFAICNVDINWEWSYGQSNFSILVSSGIRVCNLQCWYQPGMVFGVKKFFCDGINLEIRVSFPPSGIFAKASNAWHVVNAWWHVVVIVLTCNLIFSLHQEEYQVA